MPSAASSCAGSPRTRAPAVVEIEGDGFYLEPTFRLVAHPEPLDPADIELPLEELSRSTLDGVTTIRLRRPRGFVPDRLVVRTQARTFFVQLVARDASGDGETIVGTLVEELTGQREIVVQVTAWNEAQSLPVSARALLDRLRTRLAWGSTTTALRAMGLAFVRTEAPVALEPVEDGRIVSRWAMDVAFAYASIELDASNPTNWFETARIASQSLRDEGGSPLPSQVDVTIDLIPEA